MNSKGDPRVLVKCIHISRNCYYVRGLPPFQTSNPNNLDLMISGSNMWEVNKYMYTLLDNTCSGLSAFFLPNPSITKNKICALDGVIVCAVLCFSVMYS